MFLLAPLLPRLSPLYLSWVPPASSFSVMPALGEALWILQPSPSTPWPCCRARVPPHVGVSASSVNWIGSRKQGAEWPVVFLKLRVSLRANYRNNTSSLTRQKMSRMTTNCILPSPSQIVNSFEARLASLGRKHRDVGTARDCRNTHVWKLVVPHLYSRQFHLWAKSLLLLYS